MTRANQQRSVSGSFRSMLVRVLPPASRTQDCFTNAIHVDAALDEASERAAGIAPVTLDDLERAPVEGALDHAFH